MWRLGAFILFSILILSPIAQAGWGQPDLVVQEVRLSPAEPEPGDQVQLSATIANEGRGDVRQSFDVRFRVDDMTIARKRVTRLRAGRTIEVQAQWQAVEGEHRIVIEVDRPFGRVTESNERNNSLEIRVTVRRKAAVYSITAEVILSVGESLQTAGRALHFTVGSDIFAAIDQGVEQLGRAQLILAEAGRKLVQIGEDLPSPLSQDGTITTGRTIGGVFQRMADSLGTVASALRSFNVNVAVVAMGELEAELCELSRLSFGGVQLARLAEAAEQIEEATQAALALEASLFGSGSAEGGKSTDELVADFQEALGRAGDLISAVGAQLTGAFAARGISFTDAQGRELREYHAGEALNIQASGAAALTLEVYDQAGRLIASPRTSGDRLQWQGEGSSGSPLPAGEYFYRLRATRGTDEETDIGRILIS
ncbi:MAG: CARDB domain-containing protein [Candidatus Bipolaricaulia bacterium]